MFIYIPNCIDLPSCNIKELCSYCFASISIIIQFAFEIINIYYINHFYIKFISCFYDSIWEAVFFMSPACSPLQFLLASFCISVFPQKDLSIHCYKVSLSPFSQEVGDSASKFFLHTVNLSGLEPFL